jgi:electron transfer flavoprotein alpha subunit
MSTVCIVAEHHKGEIKKATLKAISFGKEAAEKIGAELHLIVIGHKISGLAEQLKGYGASKILIADNEAFADYNAETWSYVVTEAAKICDAEIVGINSGTTGKDFMPRVAVKLEAGMASDVVGFDGECFSRSMWAGNVLASAQINTRIKVVTVLTTAFSEAVEVDAETPVEALEISVPQTKSRFIEMIEAQRERPDPTEARVVVTGGRGLKSAENFTLIEQLTDLFEGAVGATRAAVDSGWVNNDLQVGQTGKIVAPDLYIAVGVSGAIQHQAGMKGSNVIVAINKDEEAPIFQIADFGIVADLFKAVPEMIELLQAEMK